MSIKNPQGRLTLTQRIRRIPTIHKPDWLYMMVMRAPSDLRIANRVPAIYGGKEERRLAMRNMALAINALRRAEKLAGLQVAS